MKRLGRPAAGAAAAFAEAGRPAMDTPWLQAGWCAVDLELTGLDPRRSEIIAVGVVPIAEGRILLGSSQYALARSKQRPEHNAVLIHKLRHADVADAPPVDEAIELVLEALTARVPVFHTAVVERTFLAPQFSRRRVRLPPAADTEVLGRLWLAQRDSESPAGVSLARLARELGQRAEPPHHALGDALTTAQAFIALARHLDRVEPQTVGSLVGAAVSGVDGAPGAGFRRFGPA
ncbi:MAG TPA: 3'-5' exonuclease [Solirubrobacteraceae bacterium]|nr:3'-5' exonuclease [Solirubrobacteraceae bacterium]